MMSCKRVRGIVGNLQYNNSIEVLQNRLELHLEGRFGGVVEEPLGEEAKGLGGGVNVS